MTNSVFQFPSDLTIYQVQDILVGLRDAWAQGTRHFDMSQLGNIDTSGAQLLASLAKTAVEQREDIFWQGWTGDASASISALGFKQLVESVGQ